ncbi:MAG: hypothetical protein NTX91_03720 [candidate division SR1 bacterium]|nr:hypothetical protein [candidate division SR1 bacterium]
MKPTLKLCLLIVTGQYPSANGYKKEQFHTLSLEDLPEDVREFISSRHLLDRLLLVDMLSEYLQATNFFHFYSDREFPFREKGARLFGLVAIDSVCTIYSPYPRHMRINNNKKIVCSILKEKFALSPGNIYPKEFASW